MFGKFSELMSEEEKWRVVYGQGTLTYNQLHVTILSTELLGQPKVVLNLQ